MPRRASGHPTELELLILKILWRRSPLLVRQVRQELAKAGRPLAHTSVITTLNIMTRKGYLKRTRRGNAFAFEPKVSRQAVSRRMLADMLQRLFDGSAAAVLSTLFDAAEIDQEELKQLRRLINRRLKRQRTE